MPACPLWGLAGMCNGRNSCLACPHGDESPCYPHPSPPPHAEEGAAPDETGSAGFSQRRFVARRVHTCTCAGAQRKCRCRRAGTRRHRRKFLSSAPQGREAIFLRQRDCFVAASRLLAMTRVSFAPLPKIRIENCRTPGAGPQIFYHLSNCSASRRALNLREAGKRGRVKWDLTQVAPLRKVDACFVVTKISGSPPCRGRPISLFRGCVCSNVGDRKGRPHASTRLGHTLLKSYCVANLQVYPHQPHTLTTRVSRRRR